MTTFEKIELTLIILFAVGSYHVASELPSRLALGLGLVWIAAIVFIQSLLRDITILFRHKSEPTKRVEQPCFCFESLVGVTLIVIGFVLFFSGNRVVLNLNDIIWASSVFLTLLTGFLIKDLVISWRPWGIRREKDHMNIIVKW